MCDSAVSQQKVYSAGALHVSQVKCNISCRFGAILASAAVLGSILYTGYVACHMLPA
jgi:hypothetical protein